MCKTDRARIVYMGATFLSDKNRREFWKVDKLLIISEQINGFYLRAKIGLPLR